MFECAKHRISGNGWRCPVCHEEAGDARIASLEEQATLSAAKIAALESALAKAEEVLWGLKRMAGEMEVDNEAGLCENYFNNVYVSDTCREAIAAIMEIKK